MKFEKNERGNGGDTTTEKRVKEGEEEMGRK